MPTPATFAPNAKSYHALTFNFAKELGLPAAVSLQALPRTAEGVHDGDEETEPALRFSFLCSSFLDSVLNSPRLFEKRGFQYYLAHHKTEMHCLQKLLKPLLDEFDDAAWRGKEPSSAAAAAAEDPGGYGGPALSSAAPVQMQQQLNELDEMEAIAAQRSSDIAQIASSVVELNRIFRDLAELVIDQGTILDRIDFNTEKIYQRSDEAKGQLHQAVKRKKESDSRAWRCLLAWGAADVILIIVLLIKYQLKYGLKNVLIFVVIAAVLCAGCYFGLKQYRPKVLAEGPAYVERIIPEGYRPEDLWKKLRPGPVNTAKTAVSAMRGGVGP
ncbi:SYP43 [Symbiodinium pilosum]|uniref:SYP43 protein n=1 Tax=Symbiodinium pilosum TaxID=2952 RepID=A0A812VAS6_SYMPI|nr:SYP43 [Symbiodinium pilosum]